MPDDVKDGLAELLPPLPGDNKPPSDIEILHQALAEESAALMTRRDQLLAGVARAPLAIGDEETCGKVADLIKLITACGKAAESTRVARKEPFLQSGRVVDGFYKGITDPLEKARKTLEPRITKYQREKAEAERVRREAEARAAAEEAERQRAAAAAAEATIVDEGQLDAAIAAESLAQQAEADRLAAEKAAQAKAADLSRSRGDYGAVASLRTVWVGELENRAALDLEALRAHLPEAALQQAINAFVRAGGRQLSGAKIYESQHTVVR